jgi:serine/threonine protein phosphatase PrpC
MLTGPRQGGPDVPDRVLQRSHVDIVLDDVHVRMRLGARDEQQDAAYVGPGVVAVADGMGGHARGADASRIALEAFAVAVEGGATLEEAVKRADAAVRSLSDGRSSRAPGTTLVAARLVGATVQGVWSGDSRAYRLGTDGVLELLTEDHRGFMGAIEHALGAFDAGPVHVDGFDAAVDGTAGLLLCTDGLTGPFEEMPQGGGPSGDASSVEGDPTRTMGALLADRGVGGLVDLAAEVGSDNVTALWWPLAGGADA